MITSGRKRILIVDDSSEIRESFISLLKDEYKVFCAEDVKESLSIMKKSEIGLIILNLDSCKIDGFELTKIIKKEYPFIYIILITAYGTKDILLKSVRNHVDDYFDKPFNINEIRQRIRELLENKEEDKIEKAKVLVEKSYGNQTLDMLSKKLYLNPKYISRIFKENNGEKFIRYRRGVRLKYAKYLIENTNHTINEIADKVGYQHSASLIRAFKEEAGCTPKQYKRNLRRKNLKII